jgi:hypothetical protein
MTFHPSVVLKGSDARDPVERLPTAAAERVRKLRNRKEELSAIANAARFEIDEVRRDRHMREQELARLTNADAAQKAGVTFFGRDEDDPEVQRARSRLASITAELARRTEAQAARDVEFRAVAALLGNLERYLAALPPGPIAEYDGPAAKGRRGESPAEALARTRAEREQLLSDLQKIRTAPRKSADVKTEIRREVEELAERGAPDVRRLLQHREPISWPQHNQRLDVYALVRTEGGAAAVDGQAAGMLFDPLGLAAWLDKDTLIRKLEAAVDSAADDSDALSENERIGRETTALTRLLELERTEAGLAEAAGELVRPDIDPRAFFNLASTAPAPRQ